MARVLVIDDDSSLLQMMSIMLKRAGHETILANNGREGIDKARSELPDIAIVDVMMPDISGFEVCRTLREDPRTVDIPLLILTALAQQEQRDRAEDSGADEYVTKPVTRDDLVNAVNNLLETGPRNMPAPLEPPPPAPFTGGRIPGPEIVGSVTDAFLDPEPPAAPAYPPAQAAFPPQQPLYTPPAPQPQYIPPAQPAAAPAAADMPLIAIMGLGRGVGSTTLAVNLSLALMQFGRSVAIDFNPQGGQLAMHLRMMPPRSSWVDLLGISPGADKRRIGAALTVGHQSGVALMAAPISPAPELLTGESLVYALQVLAEGFKRMVVDLPSQLNAMSLGTLRRARHVVLVMGDDPSSMMAAPGSLATVLELGLPGQIHVVVNRASGRGASHEDIMRALRRPLSADIPYEAAQSMALSQGIPLVMSQPNSFFAQTILHLARML